MNTNVALSQKVGGKRKRKGIHNYFKEYTLEKSKYLAEKATPKLTQVLTSNPKTTLFMGPLPLKLPTLKPNHHVILANRFYEQNKKRGN